MAKALVDSFAITVRKRGEIMDSVKGGRYKWYINNVGDKKKDGLFTGEYDKQNGNALLLTRNVETWSIPEKELKMVKKKKTKAIKQYF